jgi:Undecaprenyl-phosphate glucose phosphotransferase
VTKHDSIRFGRPRADKSHLRLVDAAGATRKPLSLPIVAGVMRIVDVLIVSLSGYAVLYVYLYPFHGIPFDLYTLSIGFAPVLQLVVFELVASYRSDILRYGRLAVGRVAIGWTSLFFIFLAIVFAAKAAEAFSRVWLYGWYVVGLLLFVASRLILRQLVKTWAAQGLLKRRVVIFGGTDRGRDLIRAIDNNPSCDFTIVAVFDDRSKARRPEIIGDHEVIGTKDELIDYVRQNPVDVIVIALPMRAEGRVLALLKDLWVLPVNIRLAAASDTIRFSSKAYQYVGNVPLLNVFEQPMTDWERILKVIEDRVLAALFLLLLSPLMLLIAVLVRLDSPGPALFRQKRYGFNNELIEVYKFRTLRHDLSDQHAAKLVTRDDQRVTRVGRFLRKTSLDELPQLFSVLKGDMSIVGPRPHAVQAKAGDRLYDDAVDSYFARHRVKPGITGWAQVNGWRGETDTRDKILRRTEFDLYYIEHWSLLFDLKIILMTPAALFGGQNAY